MAKLDHGRGSLGIGMLLGLALFALGYWWSGSLLLSLFAGVAAAALVWFLSSGPPS